MEHVVFQDSPLGILLEGEGEGLALAPFDAADRSPGPSDAISRDDYGPPLPSRIGPRKRSNTLEKLHTRLSGSRQHAAAAAGQDGNARFLEHFRYILVASHLLDEHPDPGLLRAAVKQEGEPAGGSRVDPGVPVARELCPLAILAFVGAGACRWLVVGRLTLGCSVGLGVLLVALLAAGLFSIRHLAVVRWRNEALQAGTVLVQSLHTFEVSLATSFALLQEVEVVSKGYRLSAPLPPVSRQDDVKTLRRCNALRYQLRKANTGLVASLNGELVAVDDCIDQEDYDKYIDVYDISRDEIADVTGAALPSDMDLESLGALRFLGHRSSILRRAMLCKLLSLRLVDEWSDRLLWQRRLRTATAVMNNISSTVASNNAGIVEVLKNLEHINLPHTPKANSGHANDRLRNQVRKIATLSSGIRTLQAKMTLLREESNLTLSRADDLTDLGPDLLSQYDSIGTDIQALLQDWEYGKVALSSSIKKHERRISRASSGRRSPENTLFTIPALPMDRAAQIPQASMDGLSWREGSSSPKSSMPATPETEEVFEAIALSKPRSTLSREERIQVMHEERQRAEERREARESGAVMMKELRSVISLRRRAPQGVQEAERALDIVIDT